MAVSHLEGTGFLNPETDRATHSAYEESLSGLAARSSRWQTAPSERCESAHSGRSPRQEGNDDMWTLQGMDGR